MQTFAYKAATAQGKVIEGAREALSRTALIEDLRQGGLIPIRIVVSNDQPTVILPTRARGPRLGDADAVLLMQELGGASRSRHRRRARCRHRRAHHLPAEIEGEPRALARTHPFRRPVRASDARGTARFAAERRQPHGSRRSNREAAGGGERSCARAQTGARIPPQPGERPHLSNDPPCDLNRLDRLSTDVCRAAVQVGVHRSRRASANGDPRPSRGRRFLHPLRPGAPNRSHHRALHSWFAGAEHRRDARPPTRSSSKRRWCATLSCASRWRVSHAPPARSSPPAYR